MDSSPVVSSIEEKALATDEDSKKDLISKLPDCVLAHILSKLQTKYAIATTVLSSRWKNLFSLIPYPDLEFDDTLIIYPENKDRFEVEEEKMESFAKFMYRVFNVILEDVPFISRLKLRFSMDYEDEKIHDWVNAALDRSVTILDIDSPFSIDYFFYLICGWACIEILKLHYGELIHLPESFLLPNLKCLFLDETRIDYYRRKDGFSVLLSGCPVLESLTLHCLQVEQIDNLQISNPSLKRLSICNCFNLEFLEYFQLMLDTPMLEFLYYKDYMPDEFVLNNLNSIRDVYLSVLPFKELDEDQTIEYNKRVAALVRACSSVNRLFLSRYTISALQESGEEVPMFCNLTSLRLGGFDSNGWKLLPRLLENAPKLEVLGIEKKFTGEEGCFEIFKSHLADKIPPCLLSELKKIRIFEVTGHYNEVHLIKYFLESGKALERLEIICHMPSEIYDLAKKAFELMNKVWCTCEIITANIIE